MEYPAWFVFFLKRTAKACDFQRVGCHATAPKGVKHFNLEETCFHENHQHNWEDCADRTISAALVTVSKPPTTYLGL
jgi:hypothetical protein